MDRYEIAKNDVSYSVRLAFPLVLPRDIQDRIERLLHNRRVGVGIGGDGNRSHMMIFTAAARTPEQAADRASTLLKDAVLETPLGPDVAEAIELVDVRPHRRSPGRPQPVERPPADLATRAVALPNGATLVAAWEGPTGDWIAWIEDGNDPAWKGRDLLAVLSSLLLLPHGKKDSWVYDAIRQLAGRDTPAGVRYACACCDRFTLTEPPHYTFYICPVCGWEDDYVQGCDLDYPGGANKESLRQARANYRAHGASELRRASRVRPPHDFELP